MDEVEAVIVSSVIRICRCAYLRRKLGAALKVCGELVAEQ